MTATCIPKDDWPAVLEGVSKTLLRKRVEIEIDALAIGAQVQGNWLPVLGLVYDNKDDLIEVALEGLDHLIRRPRELTIEDSLKGLVAIEIVDADDVRQILRFREPLALPSPTAS